VAAAISDYGFPAEVVDASGLAFRVLGMVCASCPPRIEMAIGRLRGVAKVEANLLLGKVVVRYNAAVVGARTIKRAIEALEYDATLWEDGDDQGLSPRISVRFGDRPRAGSDEVPARVFSQRRVRVSPVFPDDGIRQNRRRPLCYDDGRLERRGDSGRASFDVRRERRAGDARAVLARRAVLRRARGAR
jgi:copper chaperone CopZ